MLRKNEYSIPRNGLIGEWLLDGNGYDTNDGTKINGTASNVTWYTNGNNGYQKGYGYFNRSNSWIDVSSNINLGSSFTLSIWYTYDQYSAVANCLFAFDVRGVTEDRIMLFASGNTINMQYCSNGSCSWIGNTTVTHDGKWHNVLLTFGSNNVKIFFDGVLKTTNSIVSTAFNCPLSIGCWYNGSIVYPFGGNLSMMRAYNRVISDKEIQNIFLEGKRKLGICGNPEILSNLIGYWDMNGDGNDIIGGRNGTGSGSLVLSNDRFGINKAYSFNGSSFFSMTPYTSGGSNITFGGRINFTSDSYRRTIVCGQNLSGSELWELSTNGSGDVGIGIRTGSNFVKINSGISINDGGRHFVIGTKDSNGTIKIYIDGLLKNTTTNLSDCGGDAFGSNNVFYIGQNNSANQRVGYIGEIMIFNSVKTSDEINSLYQLSSRQYLYPFRKSLPRHLYDGLQLWLGGSHSGNSYYDYSDNKYIATSNNDVFDGRIFDYNYITLDGASSYLTIPDSTNLRITGPITLNIWHKWDGGSISSYSALFNKGASSEFEILFDTTTAVGNVTFYRGGTFICNTGARSNVSGKYNMYTFVDDGTNGYIYINGKLYSSGASGLTISATTNDIHICEISGNYLGGDISYPMIWNKALDGVAIQNLYYATFRL